MSYYDDVREFHEAGGLVVRDEPQIPPAREVALRNNLIHEEYREVLRAVLGLGNPAEVAKELCDLVVVVIGTALHYGIDFDAAWAEVHRSNMSKLACSRCNASGVIGEYNDEECPDCAGTGGQAERRADGKVLKGPNYQPPDMAAALGL